MKAKYKYCLIGILLIIVLVITFEVQAQRSCGTMQALEQSMQKDPKLIRQMDKIEEQSTSSQRIGIRNEIGIITVPVVVHIVYNIASQNISDAQILSQVDVLNKDFRRQNSDTNSVWSQAADSEIKFVMATIDPEDNATSGITRTSTTKSSFDTNDQVKFTSSGGHDAWPTGTYLNIWVCDLDDFLGYAQFPGGQVNTDGVVIDYQYTGTIGTASAPFDLGRTATHEVGHWLNLRHIWGDGGCGVDDGVKDTPASDAENYSCAVGHVSCGTVDMVQNYMDYSNDACMNLFTTGQKTRMRSLFEPGGFRESIIKPVSPPEPPAPFTCDSNSLVLSITFDNYPEETSWYITNMAEETVAFHESYISASDGQKIVENVCLEDGSYTFFMKDEIGDGMCCDYGNGNYSLKVFSRTLIDSDGIFGTTQNDTMSLNDQFYRFIGPGNEWETDTNWNKESVPTESYSGSITIESSCNKTDGIELIPPSQIIVSPGAFFKVVDGEITPP